MKNTISKILLAVLAASLVFAAFPVTSAYAADEDPPIPTDERLERLWSRQMRLYERLGNAFEDTYDHIARLQDWIDQAAENGRDVTTLQAALDAYEEALLGARPEYEALGQVIAEHEGFDDAGNVTDSEEAFATIQQVRDEMKSIKESMGDSFKALREAIKALREENKSERDS
ncbi:MAG: hypothetical protein OHK003_10190 [Anaerolineales bacterium]